MSPHVSSALDRWRRNVRLLGRHLRHGRASFGEAASPAKARELAALFRTVNAYLRELGVVSFLTYGTLLGWHRDGRPLPHDVDIDLAVPEAEFPRIWAARHRLPAGFRMHDTSHLHPGPKLYVEHRGWEADLYFLREEGDQLRTLERSANPGDMLPFPKSWFFPPQPAVFLDAPVWVPAQPVTYLEHLYHYLGTDAERDPVTRYFRPKRSARSP